MKRKLPPHIVLPNGQWRFVKKKSNVGVKMARRRIVSVGRAYSRHKQVSGIMSMLKPVLYGTAGGLITPRIPILNSIPFAQVIGGAGMCYLLGEKTPLKLAIGGISGRVIAPFANNAIADITGVRIY